MRFVKLKTSFSLVHGHLLLLISKKPRGLDISSHVEDIARDRDVAIEAREEQGDSHKPCRASRERTFGHR